MNIHVKIWLLIANLITIVFAIVCFIIHILQGSLKLDKGYVFLFVLIIFYLTFQFLLNYFNLTENKTKDQQNK